jgi:hypothetical protein
MRSAPQLATHFRSVFFILAIICYHRHRAAFSTGGALLFQFSPGDFP